MRSISISRDAIVRALADEIKRQSAGMADCSVVEIRGVIETGEAFVINSVEVMVTPKMALVKPSRFTPPAGVGKIKLVVDNTGVQQ